MSELIELTTQRDEIISEIEQIEKNYEGIENENNAKRVQTLNTKKLKLIKEKGEFQVKSNEIQKKLNSISLEIKKYTETSDQRILEAIKIQRWYFFKNKPKILMDKNTGLLWANLNYFPHHKENGESYYRTEAENVVNSFSDDEVINFKIPSCYELWDMIYDKTFPFAQGRNWRIMDRDCWLVEYNGDIKAKDLDDNGATADINSSSGGLIPCSDYIVNSDYKNDISSSNSIYTEKEKLEMILDMFIQNRLQPIFDDDEITRLYKKIYVDKPALLEKLQDVQIKIDNMQTTKLLSSTFEYKTLLAKYNVSSIDASVIKYYKAIQKWTDELMEKLCFYEESKQTIICDFNVIGLKLNKKYESNTNLTQEENELLSERQRFYQQKFALGMHNVKSKILAVKKQANDLEYRIDEIDNSDNSIYALALLEQENRASFTFIAENTAKIITNALKKIEYFEANHHFVMNAIKIWEEWSKDYQIFKTKSKAELKNTCEEDGIDENIWLEWYQSWQQLHFSIEEKVQPMIEYALNGTIPVSNQNDDGIVERLINALREYKEDIDQFYLEERKSIYQKYVFQSGGELQDKFETEGTLYTYAVKFQSLLQEIIFDCKNTEARILILKWANSLLDIQIDEILSFVANNDVQKISHTILEEFAKLKQKNYDLYLADSKAYAQEKSRREKQYNSLIFKMRKELIK